MATFDFDATTREQINFFFRFLANERSGIPQSDNSLVSSFIAHLYLVIGDLIIEEEIIKDNTVVAEYTLTRYVDDTFISVSFNDEIGDVVQIEYAESLGGRVADRFYHELGLRFNPKTRFFRLNDKNQLEELQNSLKKVSPKYHFTDEQDDESPTNKIENIFNELENLKNASIISETFEYELRDEILKEVFDKCVTQMLKMDDNLRRINQIFSGFDFNHVKEYPLPIIIIILNDKDTARKFGEFLIQKRQLSTRDVDLILNYLCQVDFHDKDLLEKLERYPPMKKIIRMYMEPSLSSDFPGYYNLPNTKAIKVARMPYVVEQIRYRVFHERTKSYSIALNHLLNEIHAICFELDKPKNRKDYDAQKVVAFLDNKKVPPDICISIRNLFDRRNTNQVSHPGSEENVTWSVAVDEYINYRSQIGNCLLYLF